MASEVAELFATGRKKRSTVEKHADRTKWLEEHLAETLAWLGLVKEPPAKWKVEPLLVLDTESMASQVVASPIRALSFPELRTSVEELLDAPRY
jgi:hypothetical protein